MPGVFTGGYFGPQRAGVAEISATRGRMQSTEYGFMARSTLASDQIGTCSLVLTHVAPSSRVRIEYQADGALADSAFVPADGFTLATQAGVDLGLQNGDELGFANAVLSEASFTIPVYASGYYKNYLRIKVRNASTYATAYKPWETLVTVSPGTTQSIYVNQESDV